MSINNVFTSLVKMATLTNLTSNNCYQTIKRILYNLSLRQHLVISLLLRISLIYYGQLHDAHSEVPYTDIDYKVVTDGGRHVSEGSSPFLRHTYRYSPILAYLQILNIIIHPAFGKFVYVFFDILVAILIYALVLAELKSQCRKAVLSLLNKLSETETLQPKNKNCIDNDVRNRPEKIARASACFWLYNPLTAVISTRGNGDSFSSFFVILSVYLLAKSEDVNKRSHKYWLIFSAGLIHGFAIHLRLYPLLFSLAFYLCLSNHLVNSLNSFFRLLLMPSCGQLFLIAGTMIGLFTFTGFFYQLYGWQYIYEAYLYHFVRKDVRHNFSLYFLLQYLGSTDGSINSDGLSNIGTMAGKILIVMPQILLLVYLSFSFGQFRQTLPFCIFSLTFVMVTFNTVVTSQYFVWYLALLPLCLNNLQNLSWKTAFKLFAMWLFAQGLWLLPAYLLEFKTWNTFYWIGLQSMVFFYVNNKILACLIKNYSFTSFKVNFKKLF